MFVPNPQTITILRANYAVLAILNGTQKYGTEALNQNDEQELLKNIEIIEQRTQGKDFLHKEKLLGDCIKTIANFI